jgi:ElaB/YqjD/DUF883 family membrane-anchored ribosome-binding protein
MSLRAFFLNWLGAKVPDDQLLNVEHPRFEVQWYTTMKCMQIGAVLGYAYAMRVPVMRYLGRPVPPMVSRVDYSRSVLRSSRAGMLGGLFASFPVAMIYAQQKRLNTEGAYYRRAVELRNNSKQLNLDRGSILAGLAAGAFYKGMFGLPLSLGFAQGMALGSIGVAIFNNFDWLYRKKEAIQDKTTQSAFDKLSDKVQEQAESAKGSLRKVSHQAQERAEDAKDSLKKVAEDTKDVFKRASEEGKDSLKKATYKAQDYANELKTSANELKNKAKETAQNEYKKIEHRAD